MDKISDEMLEEFACNNGLQRYNSDVTEMARELLALRAQLAELQEKNKMMVERDFVESLIAYGNEIANGFKQRAEDAEAQLAELAAQEPVAWRNPKNGNICLPRNKRYGMESAYASEYEQYSEPVFTRAAPPVPFVVKLPAVQHVYDEGSDSSDEYFAQKMYDADEVIEAIKVAGAEVADE